MIRRKSAAVKDIDIDIDIGKNDIDPPLLDAVKVPSY